MWHEEFLQYVQVHQISCESEEKLNWNFEFEAYGKYFLYQELVFWNGLIGCV
jgi:hypothetical protein